MEQVTVINTANGQEATADVLNRTSRSIKVVFVDTDITISLYKNDPTDRTFVGNVHGLEFTSTG